MRASRPASRAPNGYAISMPIQLPPSLDRSIHTVEREVERMRSLTPEQRLEIVAKVCRAAALQLAMHPRREAVLASRDPIPESTRIALRRLRAEAHAAEEKHHGS
jgi:hypothetical protein